MHYTSKEVYEYISQQTNDPIVERKTCTVSGAQFPIYQSDLDFYDKISPVINGVKYQIPTPTLCPEERERRRLARRNERKLYRRKCDASGKQIISIYSPDKPYKVYNPKIWWSDSRDPMRYGQDFDFSKGFFEQFSELLIRVPKISIFNMQSENSEYSNRCNYNKDCYLVFMTSYSENSLYGTFVQKSQYCVDCLQVTHSVHCYECYDIEGCTQIYYSNHCSNCSFSAYLDYCHGCSYCYGCSNLKNKQYCIFNKQYTKAEYENILPTITKQQLQQAKQNIQRESTLIRSENCIGTNIVDSKNCYKCYDGFNGIDSKYLLNFGDIKDCYDCTAFGYKCAMDIENIAGEEDYMIGYTFSTVRTHHVWYSMNCYDCSYLFGCDGLRNKQYCIFNKQYTKEEYEELVPKIILHMQKTNERGLFLPPSINPLGYNETVANEYYPSTKTEALRLGFSWMDQEYPINIPENAQMIHAKDVSTDINEITDEITNKIILCEESEKPFRIVKPELDFYRKHQLPIPKKHPDVRHEKRIKLRLNRNLYLRNCNSCQSIVLSNLDDTSTGKICCESCYQKELL